MTIPLRDGVSDGLLDVHTHFFEFIPESEYGRDDPVVLEAHELEEGRAYYVLLTTSSGLCRYDISDVVRCTGFFGTTPRLEFLHKGAHISSLTGEKISESQVVTAIRDAAATLGIHIEQYTVAPEWGTPPRYLLLTERGATTSGPTAPDAAKSVALAIRVDRRLQELNCEYREKRETGRLASLEARTIPVGSWKRLCEERTTRVGGSVEQYKHPCLVPDVRFVERYDSPERGTAESGDRLAS